jgi:uncharacterized protein DUF4224
MSAFISPADLARLTGSPRKSRQVAWLKARRIRHFVNAQGHPVVRREWLDGGEARPAQGPRFELLATRGWDILR